MLPVTNRMSLVRLLWINGHVSSSLSYQSILPLVLLSIIIIDVVFILYYYTIGEKGCQGLPCVVTMDTMCCVYNMQYTACLTGIIVITKIVRKPYVQKGAFTANVSGIGNKGLHIEVRIRLMCTDLIKLSFICHVQASVVDSWVLTSCAWKITNCSL